MTFRPGEAAPPSSRGAFGAPRRPFDRGAACTSRPGRRGTSVRRLPARAALGVRHRRRDGAHVLRAHVGAVQAAQARAETRRLHPRRRRVPAPPGFRYIERPPRAPAGRAPLDFFLNDSHEGYCQHYAGAMALMLRMGGIPARVATGFSPGGYSRARRPGSSATPTRTRGSRSGSTSSAGSRSIRRRPRRPRAPRSPRSPAPGAAPPRPRRHRRRDAAGDPGAPTARRAPGAAARQRQRRARPADERRAALGLWAVGVSARARVVLAVCCSCAARAARRRWTARSPRSRTRCGASGGRSLPARR